MQNVNVELFRNACAFTLSMKRFSNRRQGDMGQVETDSDKSRLKLSKQLIASPELERIVAFQGELYKWCTMRSVPSFFKEGLYLVKLDQVEGFESRLNEARTQLAALVGEFQAAYPAQIGAARLALNGQFREKDYPPVSELPARFGIDWNWIAFGVPENLPAELRAAEALKMEQKFREAEEEIMAALREGFSEILSHVTGRLHVEPGGKPKTFRNTLFDNLTEFIATFNARNLVNDQELADMVIRAQAILADVRGNNSADQAEAVRDSDTVRARTADAFAALKEQVDVIVRPSRRFDLAG